MERQLSSGFEQLKSAMGDTSNIRASAQDIGHAEFEEGGIQKFGNGHAKDSEAAINAAKFNNSTHDHIFGDKPASMKKKDRVYHMSSDIFGVGSIIDRDGSSTNGGAPMLPPTMVSSLSAETMGSEDSHDSHFDKEAQDALEAMKNSMNEAAEKKGNARENGCNPVTGDGYTQEAAGGKTQKRQYPQARSASLW